MRLPDLLGRAMAVVLLTAVMACRGVESPAAEVHTEDVRLRIDSVTTLAGSFTYPRRGRSEPLAAVLLIGGSGPQDRDGARVELPGYVPWRDLAGSLNAAGLAVLRLDDRGTGASSGVFAGATLAHFVNDAAAAVAWLRRHPRVDPARVALVGHSEGALVSLQLAGADAALRALVLLGAPSRSGRDIARWQRARLVASDLARWPAAQRPTVLANAEREADALARHDPWLRQWFATDPRALAMRVRQPVLLVHGATDQQVPVDQADELAAVLREAGAHPVEVQRWSDTDHLLLPDHDGDPEQYVRLGDRRVRAGILAATTHFLSVHTAPR